MGLEVGAAGGLVLSGWRTAGALLQLTTVSSATTSTHRAAIIDSTVGPAPGTPRHGHNHADGNGSRR